MGARFNADYLSAHSASAAMVNDVFELMAKSIKEGTEIGEFKKTRAALWLKKAGMDIQTKQQRIKPT